MKTIPIELAPWVQQQAAVAAILNLNPARCTDCWYHLNEDRCPHGAYVFYRLIDNETYCPFWEPKIAEPLRKCAILQKDEAIGADLT